MGRQPKTLSSHNSPKTTLLQGKYSVFQTNHVLTQKGIYQISCIPIYYPTLLPERNTYNFIIIQYRRFTLFRFPNQLISIITFLSTRSSLSHHNDYCYHLLSIDTLYCMCKYVEVVDATRRSINVIGYMKDTIQTLYILSF